MFTRVKSGSSDFLRAEFIVRGEIKQGFRVFDNL